METVAGQASCCVGIDVSKNQLDVHVRRPGGCVSGADVFVVNRDAAGLDELVARLKPLRLQAVAVEASGGFEKLVVASLVSVCSRDHVCRMFQRLRVMRDAGQVKDRRLFQ